MLSIGNMKDYAVKQAKFSFGNLFSVPIGTGILFLFTTELHIWYIYSSFLSLLVTTTINFWIQVALKVINNPVSAK